MKKNILKRISVMALASTMMFTQLPLQSLAADVEVATVAEVQTASEDNATYLSDAGYAALSESDKAYYTEFCGMVKDACESGFDTNAFVAAVDTDGQLVITIDAAVASYYTATEAATVVLPVDEEEEAETVLTFASEEATVGVGENLDIIGQIPAELNEDIDESFDFATEPSKKYMNADYDANKYTDVETEDFNTLMLNEKWFFNQLTAIGKKAFSAGYKSIVVNGGNKLAFNAGSVKNLVCGLDALNALTDTYPEAFDFYDRSRVGTLYQGSNTKISFKGGKGMIELQASPYYSEALEKQAQAKVATVAEEAKKYALKNYPDAYTYGVVEYIDSWICNNTYYNYTGTYESALGTEEYYNCHVVYGALLKGYSVCESYALTASRILDEAGVPNQYVVGNAGGGHAWNYVMMPNDKWYMLDTTWDDSAKTGKTTKEYFLVGWDMVHVGEGTGLGFIGLDRNTRCLNLALRELSNTDYGKATPEIFEPVYVVAGTKVQAPETYTIKGATWSIDNTKIATVNKNGEIKAKKAGECVLTYSYDGVNGYSAKLVVVDKIKGIKSVEGYKKPVLNAPVNSRGYVDFTISPGDLDISPAALDGLVKDYISFDITNKSAVNVAGHQISGNTLRVYLTTGVVKAKTKIKINCGGKKITLKVNVGYN